MKSPLQILYLPFQRPNFIYPPPLILHHSSNSFSLVIIEPQTPSRKISFCDFINIGPTVVHLHLKPMMMIFNTWFVFTLSWLTPPTMFRTTFIEPEKQEIIEGKYKFETTPPQPWYLFNWLRLKNYTGSHQNTTKMYHLSAKVYKGHGRSSDYRWGPLVSINQSDWSLTLPNTVDLCLVLVQRVSPC